MIASGAWRAITACAGSSYDSGIKPGDHACTVAGCNASHEGKGHSKEVVGRCRLLRAAEREHQPIRQAGRLVALATRPSRNSLAWAKNLREDDPYWDFFINTPPADLANTVTEMIRNAPEGNVFPTKAELHTPEITSSHVKGLARYFGAEMVGIARLGVASSPHPSRRSTILSPSSARSRPIMILDNRGASAARCPCRKDCLLPSFSAHGSASSDFELQRHWIPVPSSWLRQRASVPSTRKVD